MSTMLINRKLVRKNKDLKRIQKQDLKAHKSIKGNYPKAKLGKIIERSTDSVLDCVKSEKVAAHFNLRTATPEILMEKLRELDIRGMSGSAFPTWEKIDAVNKSGAKEKYLVVNGIACDPALLHDEWLLMHKREELKKGIHLLKKSLNLKEAIIGTRENTPNRYPMGEEKILVKTLLNIDIPANKTPAEMGILVFNVQTVIRIYEALYLLNRKKIKYITAANLTTGKGQVVKAYIGQTVSHILRQTTIGYESGVDMFEGSGAMDASKVQGSATITEKTNFVGFGQAAVLHNEARCRMCGACRRYCPEHVDVVKILHAIHKKNGTDLKQFGIMNCIQCGSCTYYCKAGRNIMEMIKKEKERIEQDEKDITRIQNGNNEVTA